jgi:hypothetical protein
MEKQLAKGRFDMPFGAVAKGDVRGFRTDYEKSAKVTHQGPVVDAQSRALLPFARWLKVFKRFKYSYLKIHLQTDDAHLEMERYEAQMMAVTDRYAHHPQRDFCVAKIDQAYRSRMTTFCIDSGGTRPDWVVESELFLEILGPGVATCRICGQSGHEEWMCQVGAQAAPPTGWPPAPYQPPPVQPAPTPHTPSNEVCNAFSSQKGCRFGPKCKYRHVCNKCGKEGHPGHQCRSRG